MFLLLLKVYVYGVFFFLTIFSYIVAAHPAAVQQELENAKKDGLHLFWWQVPLLGSAAWPAFLFYLLLIKSKWRKS